jgi:hypothetical protein
MLFIFSGTVVQTLPVIEFRSDCYTPGRCESFCCPPPPKITQTNVQEGYPRFETA